MRILLLPGRRPMPAERRPGPSKRRAARLRIEQGRAAEVARARAQRRRRSLAGGVVAALLVVIAVVVVIAVRRPTASTAADGPVPANTVDSTVVAVGRADAPVTLDLYEDFQCPHCQAFEEESGPTVARLIADGTVRARYHGMAFLDTDANGGYSTRALDAAAAVVDAAGPDAYARFHELLFAHQPPEGGSGLTDDQLVDYAARAGASGASVERDIRGLTYRDWVARATDQAGRDGVTRTPTVLVDGQRLTDLSAAGLTAAVTAAGR